MTYTKAALARIAVLLLALVAGFSVEVYAQGNCALSEAEAYLDINNVRARIFNNGTLFWRGDPAVYEVPKGSGINSVFAANFWVGGLVNDELRVAAARYSNFQFWPGPLNDDGTLPNPDDCSGFDHIYKVYLRDLNDYDATGRATQDLLEWPWQLGAPVIDADGDPNNYNLEGGDRPEVLGHQTLWWVMNDVGNEHLIPSSDTPPIKLEVQVTAFSARSDIPAIDDATLYRYKLIYRGQTPLENAYVGFFVDPDLGNFDDDYIGSDSTLDLGYVYNADNNDEGDGGYGENPPALGLGVLQGPLVNDDGTDNDDDGTIDEADERLGMTDFMSFNNRNCIACYLQGGSEYYNYMQARWRDGKQITLGGDGRDFSEVPTHFMFSGDPVTGAFWTELNSDGNGTAIAPYDRRFVMASGPFTMQPGDVEELYLGIMWARGADHLASVEALRQATQVVRDAFAAGFDVALPPVPTEAARLASPADRATGQPTNPTLHWESVADADEYQVELATDDLFSMGVRQHRVMASSFVVEELGQDSTYFWRVRGVNAAGFGPWSDAWRFSTSTTTLMGGGVLTFDDGTPAFVEVVGPGDVDPCGPEASSTFGCAEVGGNNVWNSFNGTGEYILGSPSVGPEQRIGAFVPNDFELRVTERGSYGYHVFTTGTAIWTPVEVWDIGPTGPFNDNDPADDVQMIVTLFSDSGEEGECSFDYGELELFGRAASDRVYASYPIEGASYDDYATLLEPLVDSDPNGCPTDPVTATAATLIDRDRGRPIQRVVFIDNTGGAKEVADLIGTVIRFYTTEKPLSAPAPSAPVNRAVNLPFTVSLWWSAPPGAVRFHLQVSPDANFTANLVDNDTLVTLSFTVQNVPVVGSYYWRVRAFNEAGASSDWSEVWAFTVGTATAVEDPDVGIPATFQLSPNYPNPFNPETSIRFGLPVASAVTVTIYNVLGQRVATLAEGRFEAGWHAVQWNAQDVGSGVYFYRIEAGAFRETRTMLLLK